MAANKKAKGKPRTQAQVKADKKARLKKAQSEKLAEVPKPKKPKGKPGRPTVFTDEVKAKILNVFEAGMTQNDAADIAGVGRGRLSEYLQNNEGFSEQVRAAKAEGKQTLVKAIRRSDKWQAQAFLLERRYPEEYGKQRLEITGADGGPIKVETKERLKGLTLEKLLKLRDAINESDDD